MRNVFGVLATPMLVTFLFYDLFCSCIFQAVLLLLITVIMMIIVYSFLASGDFCHLLHTCITAFANSLDPDQDRQNVGPNLDQTV